MMQEKTNKELASELHSIAYLLTQRGYAGGKIVTDLRELADRLWEISDGN